VVSAIEAVVKYVLWLLKPWSSELLRQDSEIYETETIHISLIVSDIDILGHIQFPGAGLIEKYLIMAKCSGVHVLIYNRYSLPKIHSRSVAHRKYDRTSFLCVRSMLSLQLSNSVCLGNAE
jgi:hypothetical protein